MKTQFNWTLAILISIITLIVGIAIGAVGFSKEVEIPGQNITTTEYVNVTVEKIVNQTVIVDKFADSVALAKEEYKDELADDDDYLVCNGNQYDFDQVIFRKVNNLVMSVDTSDKDDTVTVISFDQELKFSDKDVDTKCYLTQAVKVTFHSDEDIDTEISIN